VKLTAVNTRFRGVVDREDFRHAGAVWTVAEEYALEGEQIVVRGAGRRKLYAPLQEADLFLSFARLASRGRPSEWSVLRWVRKYGLLRRADETADVELPGGAANQSPASVEELASEAREARSALALYADLSRGGIEGIKKRIVALYEDFDRGGALSETDRYFAVEWGPVAGKLGRYNDKNLQVMATATLEGFVTERLEEVRLAPWSGEYALGSWAARYRPVPSFEVPDLFSAVYLQFYLMMTSNLAMRRCENPACGLPIPATRKNRRFCNPTCRSNMRHYR
jgi:hypothetical protein